MEDLEIIEINTDDIVETDIIDTDVATSNQMNTQAKAYTSNIEKGEDDYKKPSSSTVPLCITVIFCLALGIVLGFFMARRDVNK